MNVPSGLITSVAVCACVASESGDCPLGRQYVRHVTRPRQAARRRLSAPYRLPAAYHYSHPNVAMRPFTLPQGSSNLKLHTPLASSFYAHTAQNSCSYPVPTSASLKKKIIKERKINLFHIIMPHIKTMYLQTMTEISKNARLFPK